MTSNVTGINPVAVFQILSGTPQGGQFEVSKIQHNKSQLCLSFDPTKGAVDSSAIIGLSESAANMWNITVVDDLDFSNLISHFQ